MSRFSRNLIGLAAATALPAAAFGQVDPSMTMFTPAAGSTIDFAAPILNNVEVAGPRTMVLTTNTNLSDGGGAANMPFANNEALSVTIVIVGLDNMGAIITRQTLLAGAGALNPAMADGDGDLPNGLTINMQDPSLASLNALAGVVGATSGVTKTVLGVVINGAAVGFETAVNASEAMDTMLDYDNVGPSLASVFIGAADLNFVFNEPIFGGGASNGTGGMALGNETDVAGMISSLDFQIAGGTPLTGLNVNAANTTAVGTSNGIAIQTDFMPADGSGLNVSSGSLVNVVTMDMINMANDANTDIRDLAGNRLLASNNPSATVATQPVLQVTGASWVAPVPANFGGGGPFTSAGALAVDFNVELSNVGMAAFYQGLFVSSGANRTNIFNAAAANRFNILNPTLDPSNPRRVLLDVETGNGVDTGDLGVWGDGNNQDSNFTLPVVAPDVNSYGPNSGPGVDLDGDGEFNDNNLPFSMDFTQTPIANTPTDIFNIRYGDADNDGTNNEMATQTQISVGDEIPLSPLAVGFTDRDGDGIQDAITVDYGEGMPTSVETGAAPAGVTARLLDNVAVTPAALVDPITGALPTMLVTNTPMDMPLAVTLTGASYSAQRDYDGDGLIDPLRETTNALDYTFNASAIDFDNDGNADGMDAPGTGDPGVFDLSIDVAMATSLQDNAGNPLGASFMNMASVTDFASPTLLFVNFFTGDNIAAGMQKLTEQDNAAGDQENNDTVSEIYSEAVGNNPANPTSIDDGSNLHRYGAGIGFDGPGAPGAGNGDFTDMVLGVSGNVLQFTDTNPKNVDGLEPSTTGVYSVLSANGVFDFAGNEFAGTTSALPISNRTSIFVSLLENGVNDVLLAFLVDDDSAGDTGFGFADFIDLYFTGPVDAATVQAANFSVTGIQQSSISVTVSNNRVRIGIPDDRISMDDTPTVTYNGGSDSTPVAGTTQTTPVAMMNDVFTAQRVPEPAVDGEFLANMEIVGSITGPDGALAGPGARVYGVIAVPVAKKATFTMGNVRSEVTSSSSLNAITNRLLGLSAFLYLGSDGQRMEFENSKTAGFGGIGVGNLLSLLQITLQANNLSNVTFTGNGSTVSSNFNPATASISQGNLMTAWSPLRSATGTAQSLVANGFNSAGPAVVSSAVVLDDSGTYRLHMTAPVAAFGDLVGATGWPVIIVVELPDGKRYIASTLRSAVDGNGPILFNADNRQQSGNTSDDPMSAVSATTFNIDLRNLGQETVRPGWQILADNTNAGSATTAANVPNVLPAGVNSANIRTSDNSLANNPAFNRYGFFRDGNGDGDWTAGDDLANFLDSLIVDVNCISHVRFTMDSRGIRIGSNSGACIGGYATGFLNRTGNTYGVFQPGPPRTATTLFASGTFFPNSTTTLGWGLLTSPVSQTNLTTFFTNNPRLDYVIQFFRDATGVDIATRDEDGNGDLQQIFEGRGYFFHFDAN